jgi:hypothetical protein
MSVRADVDRGLEIVARIAALEEELEQIETRLEKAGLEAGSRGEHQPLADEDRDGKRWLAKGSAMGLPLIFTADKIVGTFAAGSARHKAIHGASNSHFLNFFKSVHAYENLFKDGKQFRKQAHEVLGKDAPAFITACLATDKAGIPKSDIKILWEESEELKPVTSDK